MRVMMKVMITVVLRAMMMTLATYQLQCETSNSLLVQLVKENVNLQTIAYVLGSIPIVQATK